MTYVSVLFYCIVVYPPQKIKTPTLMSGFCGVGWPPIAFSKGS